MDFALGQEGILLHCRIHQTFERNRRSAPQISFTPNGNFLMVTEKATNKISSFKVKNDGSVAPDVADCFNWRDTFWI